jgi:hypothetical protein
VHPQQPLEAGPAAGGGRLMSRPIGIFVLTTIIGIVIGTAGAAVILR